MLKGQVDVVCPYCSLPAKLVGGSAIYPHRPDLYHKRFYQCAPCGAYVGCHPGTTKPLGRLATEELRKMKSAAHAAFDTLWKSGRMTRKDAYAWLAAEMELPSADCHIGMFDEDQCRRVVRIVKARAR